MKHPFSKIIFLYVILLISCKTEDNNTIIKNDEYPEIYLYNRFDLESIKAFDYDGSEFSPALLSWSYDPNFGDHGFLKRIQLTSDMDISVTDELETSNSNYTLNNGILSFHANGSQFDLNVSDDETTLELLVGRAGYFLDDNNTWYASATCSDINCDEDISELLIEDIEEERHYFIVYKETYVKQ